MSSRKDRRMLRSSLSRARDFGSLSTRAQLLYVLLVLNADDQGRLQAAPDIIKLDVCPRVPDVTMEEIPGLLQEMERAHLVRVYDDGSGEPVLQLLQWWEEQRTLQWAYPSDYPPPDGWDDCLRFRQGGSVITLNWPSTTDGATTVPLSDATLSAAPWLSLCVRPWVNPYLSAHLWLQAATYLNPHLSL